MREIITIQVGTYGNSIGSKFWNEISGEHRIDLLGIPHGDDDSLLDRIDVFYDQSETGNYTRRSILVDTDTDSLKSTLGGNSVAFSEKDFVTSGIHRGSTCGNYAIGQLEFGNELSKNTLELVRQKLEKCDSPQGFQLIHSLSGGTGSGVGARILGKFKEEYPHLDLHAFTLFPSISDESTPHAVYNTVLSFSHVHFDTDAAHCFDMSAINKMCANCSQDNVSLDQLSEIIAINMSSLTTSLRFNGGVFDNLLKITTNMIPFPQQHYFMSGFSPLIWSDVKCKTPPVGDLIHDLFSQSNMFVDCCLENGKLISGLTTVRGQSSLNEIDKALAEIREKSRFMARYYLTDNLKNIVNNVKIRDFSTSAGVMVNHSSIHEFFSVFYDKFKSMWKKKLHAHLYTGEGMDAREFDECHGVLGDLISEYSCNVSESSASNSDDEDDD